MRKLAGTDMKLDYEFVRNPDHPPVVLAVHAPRRQHWNEKSGSVLIGQEIGIHWPEGTDRIVFVRVVAAVISPFTNKRLELTCR